MAKTFHQSKTIPYNFGQKHIDYIRKSANCIYNIAEGAVRAGKTIDNVYAFAHELCTTPDKIHLATGSTAANAKLNIGDANGFGLEYYFRGQCRWGKYKGNECLVIQGPSTGYKQKVVIFSGGALANSYKKIRGNSYGMWIATEINLHHDDTIKEAFNRTLASKRRKFFWDLNPDNPNAPIYVDYIDKYRKKDADGTLLGGVNYEHFTIFDNINVSEASRQATISQYDVGSLWYRRDIEGERCIAEGLVYALFDEKRHIVDDILPPNPRHRYFVSIDYGTVNPFAAGLWDVDEANKTATMLRELYYSGSSNNRKSDEEYYKMLDEFIGEYDVEWIVIDPSASSMIEAITRHGKYICVGGQNDVRNGIQCVTRFLRAGNLRFSRSCENTFGEFRSYCWDKEASEKNGKDEVIKRNDHAMDMIRYFCYTTLRTIFWWVTGE